MAYWMYKCNSAGKEHQRQMGDWATLFAGNRPDEWGSTKYIPQLALLRPGDLILAYQTNRNELVGLAKVKRWDKRGRYKEVILEPVESIGAKLKPLKEQYKAIATIPALQGGPIKTLYDISDAHAQLLLSKCRSAKGASPSKRERRTAARVLTELHDLPQRERQRVMRMVQQAIRDARLRPRVCLAWGYKCAVCDLSLGNGAGEYECEVAHIHEVHDQGRDSVKNAFPLCRTHHWAFDRHLWGINPKTLQIVVRPNAPHVLKKLHGKRIVDHGPLAQNSLKRRWAQFNA